MYQRTMRLSFAMGQDQDQMNLPTDQDQMTSQENRLLLPTGMFCFFTCNELMFESKMQEVVPTARRLGAGMLLEHQIVFQNNGMNYNQPSSQNSFIHENIWGALYAVSEEHFALIEKYVLRQDSLALISAVQVETTDYQKAQCLAIDLGLRPNSYPITNPSANAKSLPNMPTCDDFGKELHECGAPEEYYEQMQNIPYVQQMCSVSPQSSNGYNTPSYPFDLQSPFTSSSGPKETFPDNGMNSPFSPPPGGTIPRSLSSNPDLGSSTPPVSPYGPDTLGDNSPTGIYPSAPYSSGSDKPPYNTNGYSPNQNQNYSPDTDNNTASPFMSPNAFTGMSPDNGMSSPYGPSFPGNTAPRSLSPNPYEGLSTGNSPILPYGPDMLGGNNPTGIYPSAPSSSGSDKPPYNTNGCSPDQNQNYWPDTDNNTASPFMSPNAFTGMSPDNGMSSPYGPSFPGNTAPRSLSPNPYEGLSTGNSPILPYSSDMLGGNNPAGIYPSAPSSSGSDKPPYNTNGCSPDQNQNYWPDTDNNTASPFMSPNAFTGMSPDNGMSSPYGPSFPGNTAPRSLSPNPYEGLSTGNSPISPYGPDMLGDNSSTGIYPSAPYSSGSDKPPYNTNGYSPNQNQNYSPDTDNNTASPFMPPNTFTGMPPDNGMSSPYGPSSPDNTIPKSSLSPSSFSASPNDGKTYPMNSAPKNMPYSGNDIDQFSQPNWRNVLPTGIDNNFSPGGIPSGVGSQSSPYGPKGTSNPSDDDSPYHAKDASQINSFNSRPRSSYTPQFTPLGPTSRCDNNSAAGFSVAAYDSEFCNVTPKNYKPSLLSYDSKNLFNPPPSSQDYFPNNFGLSQITPPSPSSEFLQNNFAPLQMASPSTSGYSQSDLGSLQQMLDTKGQENENAPNESEIMINESSFQNVQYSETRTDEN